MSNTHTLNCHHNNSYSRMRLPITKKNNFSMVNGKNVPFSKQRTTASTCSTNSSVVPMYNEIYGTAIQTGLQLSCNGVVSSRSWLNSTCTSAPTKKARAVQWTKQTPKPFAILRRIAITISATSHWLTHLFFCRTMDMENSLISMCKRWRNVLMVEKILIPISFTSSLHQLSYVVHTSSVVFSCVQM